LCKAGGTYLSDTKNWDIVRQVSDI
jgi:hypothetical protein